MGTGRDGTGGAKTFLQCARSMDITFIIGSVVEKVFRSNIDNEDGTGWNEERRKPFCSVQHPWKTHL